MTRALCPEGRPDPGYPCRFCFTPIHSGDDACQCSVYRTKITAYASLCRPCAVFLDMLTGDTRLGRIHRRLVEEADMRGRPSSD